ncbi:MAG: DUF3703 domain-containing protein [Bacteroidia bacterium]|jgi:hypothetical protein
MKFYTNIPRGLELYYQQELGLYKVALDKGDYSLAWKHLENAHILGQAYPTEHTKVHWLMLKFGFRIKNIREITGQIPRLIFGGIKSFVGTIPVGNTGGANVSAVKPIEIPDNLKRILDKYKLP